MNARLIRAPRSVDKLLLKYSYQTHFIGLRKHKRKLINVVAVNCSFVSFRLLEALSH